jgi:hypothetical protein
MTLRSAPRRPDPPPTPQAAPTPHPGQARRAPLHLLLSPPVLTVLALVRLLLGTYAWEPVTTGGDLDPTAMLLGPLVDLSYSFSVLILAAWIATLVHESGHTLAGWLAGYRLVVYNVGPLALSFRDNHWRVRLNWSWQTAGLMSAVPVTDGPTLWRDVAMLAAGPLAGFGLTAVLVAGFGNPFMDLPSRGWVFLSDNLAETTAFLSLIVSAASLVPYTAKIGTVSDGGRILMLLRNDPRAAPWNGIRRLHGAIINGQRTRDWSVEWLKQVTSIPDFSPIYATGVYFTAMWMLDRGDIAGAGVYLDQVACMEKVEEWRKGSGFYIEAAYYEARHRGNVEAARYYLDQSAQLVTKDYPEAVLRAEAAIALAAGNYALARERVQQAFAAIRTKKHHSRMVEVDIEMLNGILAESER